MNIKGMNKDMRCRGFQFEIGKEYKIENNGEELELCSDTVFHYCKTLQQVHKYYRYNDKTNRYFEIEVIGEEITDGKKCGSNHIRILREITGEELNNLKGLNNGNTGLFNSGYRNSGDRNSGDWNSGDNNSGYWNSGYRNSGDNNSGIANKCDYSNGVFCNESDANIRIFNKPSGMSLRDFCDSEYWKAMCSAPFNLTEWTEYTKEEKETDQEKEKIGGYLKTHTYKEAWANWWNMLSDENKAIIQQIPNFDKEVFKDITGIEV